MLDDDNVFYRELKVPVAYHSDAMRRIEQDYLSLISDIDVGNNDAGEVTILSSVTGEVASREFVCKPRYWVDNLMSPVRFADALSNMCTHDVILHSLLEIGPHAPLRTPIRDTLKEVKDCSNISYHATLIRSRSSVTTFLEALGELHCLGHDIDSLAASDGQNQHMQKGVLTDLPLYPFDHSKVYWLNSRISKGHRLRQDPSHPILGVSVPDWNPFEPRWRLKLRLSDVAFIEDHRVESLQNQ
jgi:acyl transferase domain-containing protein